MRKLTVNESVFYDRKNQHMISPASHHNLISIAFACCIAIAVVVRAAERDPGDTKSDEHWAWRPIRSSLNHGKLARAESDGNR